MRNLTKFISLILAIVMVFSLASCTLTKAYSYKTEDVELPIGVYIYQVYAAYQSALNYAKESDVYNSEDETFDGSKSFLKVEITDGDGNKATADEWIVNEADKNMKNILALYHEFNRLGSTIDEATAESYNSACKEVWDYGPYYQYYGEQYKSPYSDIFEPMGVSYDSFYLATYYQQLLSEAVFNDLYGATGDQAVSDEELAMYFEENYTSYKYFSTNLYKTETTTNEDGEDQETSVALSDEEISDIKDKFNTYVEEINDGTSFDDVAEEFKSDFELEDDPVQSGVEIMKDSSIGEDLVNAISALEQGQASTEVIGEDTSAVIYLFYKGDITDKTEEQLTDETNRSSVLHNYKDKDFTDYLFEVAEGLTIDISSECGKYSPSKIEKMVSEQEKKSA